MKKMFSVGMERETKQLLKRTQARVKNVVLKNRVLLAFISDSGFETQQKEKWKWDLPAVMRKGVSSPALICPTGECWQWWAGVGRESEQCYKGRWWTYLLLHSVHFTACPASQRPCTSLYKKKEIAVKSSVWDSTIYYIYWKKMWTHFLASVIRKDACRFVDKTLL